ncbi:uroporphyrinogen-III C-methyltransferase [Candidatus Zinderia endosymbiont of Aphrophora alni]|uniref:uroporphyrinogen-III C-methyltransferase n=1 Tax=Candidatus Zinderia endosymbiont of Aphrophora alni TaxID=3077951 RepID=UPI0030D18FC0
MFKYSNLTPISKIFFIGAGPGAIDLITIRGYNILIKTDIILYDALIFKKILNFSPNSKKIFVGKKKNEKHITQKIINEYLIYFAFHYNFIVRLKSGDPMIFSRINEELKILEKYYIPYEIIPGITSALAAASSSRRPLTKRNICRSISLFTTTFTKKKYIKYCQNNCTLIQYMSGKNIKKIINKLITIGYNEHTPIIIIENCSYYNESIFYLKLKFLKNVISNFTKPVIIIIGNSLKNY